MYLQSEINFKDNYIKIELYIYIMQKHNIITY